MAERLALEVGFEMLDAVLLAHKSLLDRLGDDMDMARHPRQLRREFAFRSIEALRA